VFISKLVNDCDIRLEWFSLLAGGGLHEKVEAQVTDGTQWNGILLSAYV
jgi:hypothetical protein